MSDTLRIIKKKGRNAEQRMQTASLTFFPCWLKKNWKENCCNLCVHGRKPILVERIENVSSVNCKRKKNNPWDFSCLNSCYVLAMEKL